MHLLCINSHDWDIFLHYISAEYQKAQNKIVTFPFHSGEGAFRTLALPLGWAKRPMIQRIGDIEKELPITFIYGSRTWMDRECGNQSKYLRPDSRVDVEVWSMILFGFVLFGRIFCICPVSFQLSQTCGEQGSAKGSLALNNVKIALNG